jgi:hypothetical protein
VVLSGEGADEILVDFVFCQCLRLKIFRETKKVKNYSQLIYYEQIKQ